LVSAQTSAANVDINVLVRLLQSLIQQLQQQLQQLLAQRQAQSPSLIQVISPRVGENWQIGQPHIIRLSRDIDVNFPLDSQVMIQLVYKEGESPLGGTIACVKQASNQTEFVWDRKTLMNFCGAADPVLKYKSLYPGYYQLRFIRDDSSLTILAQSGLFWLTGEPFIFDYTGKPIGG